MTLRLVAQLASATIASLAFAAPGDLQDARQRVMGEAAQCIAEQGARVALSPSTATEGAELVIILCSDQVNRVALSTIALIPNAQPADIKRIINETDAEYRRFAIAAIVRARTPGLK